MMLYTSKVTPNTAFVSHGVIKDLSKSYVSSVKEKDIEILFYDNPDKKEETIPEVLYRRNKELQLFTEKSSDNDIKYNVITQKYITRETYHDVLMYKKIASSSEHYCKLPKDPNWEGIRITGESDDIEYNATYLNFENENIRPGLARVYVSDERKRKVKGVMYNYKNPSDTNLNEIWEYIKKEDKLELNVIPAFKYDDEKGTAFTAIRAIDKMYIIFIVESLNINDAADVIVINYDQVPIYIGTPRALEYLKNVYEMKENPTSYIGNDYLNIFKDDSELYDSMYRLSKECEKFSDSTKVLRNSDNVILPVKEMTFEEYSRAPYRRAYAAQLMEAGLIKVYSFDKTLAEATLYKVADINTPYFESIWANFCFYGDRKKMVEFINHAYTQVKRILSGRNYMLVE